MTSTFLSAGSLGLMGVVAVAAGLASANAAEKRVNLLLPLAGVSLDVGRSHAVAYFVPQGGVCSLTMVVGERATADSETPGAGTRFNVSIEGGKRARIDTAEGKSVEVTCAPGATMASLRKLDTVAYSAPRRD